MNNFDVHETQPKKEYNAPRVIEHGTIENITGGPSSPFGCSGLVVPDGLVIPTVIK